LVFIKAIFATADLLIAFHVFEKRKVRTPQGSIAGNARRFEPIAIGIEKGQVQQKVCTDNAVVKPGKLYAVKCQVYQQFLFSIAFGTR
jgi:hypothetical protein